MSDIWIALVAAWILSAILELVAGRYLTKYGALSAQILSMCAAGVLIGLEFNLLSVLFLILAIYRSANLFRVIAGRLEAHYLRRASTRASSILLACQLALLAIIYYFPLSLDANSWLKLLTASQLLVAAVFAASLLRQLAGTRFVASTKHYVLRDLPTLTVAIPAKNETYELENCLKSILASDYPKLEVLVLDDSAGSKTGEIINALAHDGVRFILGEQPTHQWLAKNLAYDRLAAEANGEIILFCGVDVRFAPKTLTMLVEKMLASEQQMLSLMPLNQTGIKSLVIQPMRYFWELARPRVGASLPVLSTCWLIQKSALASAGGFKSVAREIIPERHFASYCSDNASKYSFFRASAVLGLASTKTSREQQSTAIRTRYPLLHKRIASAAGTSLFELAFLLAPLILVILLPFYGWSLLAEILAVVSTLTWLAIYGAIIKLQFKASFWLAPSFWLAATADICLVNLSLVKYEFGQVLWKGRNVAEPVMNLIKPAH